MSNAPLSFYFISDESLLDQVLNEFFHLTFCLVRHVFAVLAKLI
jgi:hypothetical protein